MVRVRVSDDCVPTKIIHRAQRLFTTKKRTIFRPRRSPRTYTRTPEERKLAAENRAARQELKSTVLTEAKETITKAAEKVQAVLGDHDRTYYQQVLLQNHYIKGKQRRVSSWNAFQHMRLKEMNSGAYSQLLICYVTHWIQSDLPDGAPRLKLKDAMGTLTAEWKHLSDEEKATLTEESLNEIKENREARALGRHNTHLEAFNDAQAVLKSISRQVSSLVTFVSLLTCLLS